MPPSFSDLPPHRGLATGDRAPAFKLIDPLAGPMRSEDLLPIRPVLLTFYRGAWCPCCQADLRDLRETRPRLETMDITVLGVFHELSVEGCNQIHNEYDLPFPMVDDPQGRAAESFGVRRPAEELARIEEELPPELLALRQGQPWILPMQARYLVTSDGLIAHAELVDDYRKRTNLMTWLPAALAFQ